MYTIITATIVMLTYHLVGYTCYTNAVWNVMYGIAITYDVVTIVGKVINLINQWKIGRKV